jgi:hypothetical protein
MKATFFFSAKQKRTVLDLQGYYTPLFIDGKEYTEVNSLKGEHKSNYSDAVIVAELDTPDHLLTGLNITFHKP